MSDRRLWLEEPCPTCGARSGLRCQTSRYGGKPTPVLHGARGWRHRSCPSCKAQPGELCRTPTGRRASQPHTARLQRGRRELFADEQVWEELERWERRGRAGALLGGRRQPGQHRRGDARGREEARACPLGKRRGRAAGSARRADLGPLRAVPRPSTDQRAVDVGRAGAPGRCRGRARRAEVRGAAVRAKALCDRHARGRHCGATRRGDRLPGRARHVASRSRRGGVALVRALRRAAPGGAARGGAVLLQALPAGRLARAAEGPPSLPAAQPGRDVRVVWRADARWPASGGTVLLQAVPAGVLATRPQASAAALRRPRARATRRALETPRRGGSGGCGWSVWRWAT